MRRFYDLDLGMSLIEAWIINALCRDEVSVIAFAGGSASGKSYLAREFVKWEGVDILSQDRYIIKNRYAPWIKTEDKTMINLKLMI